MRGSQTGIFTLSPPTLSAFLLPMAWFSSALLPATLGHAASADEFSSADKVFHDVDHFWSQQIASLGGRYQPAKLAHFTPSAAKLCGLKVAVSGPFYCPGEQTVYLDDTFLQRLQRQARDQSSLALGYVVAHEVAHHIQAVMGTTALVEQARARSTPEIARRSWVTMELQADCYAGLWAHAARSQASAWGAIDVDAMLARVAAAAKEQQSHLADGQQMIDPWNQGTAEQRSKWFRLGLDQGSFNDCDTFGAEAAGHL